MPFMSDYCQQSKREESDCPKSSRHNTVYKLNNPY